MTSVGRSGERATDVGTRESGGLTGEAAAGAATVVAAAPVGRATALDVLGVEPAPPVASVDRHRCAVRSHLVLVLW
jgi:hypothetical protein